MSKALYGGVGLLFLLILFLVMNMASGPSKSMQLSQLAYPLQPQPPAAELVMEVEQLRTRVAKLEKRLGAQLTPRMEPRMGPASTRPSYTPHSLESPAQKASPADTDDAFTTPTASLPQKTPAKPAPSASSLAVGRERTAPAPAPGVVQNASWWSDKQVERVPGFWCPKPPPYAALKPELPKVDPGTLKPLLTAELAKKCASEDNMLIVTYVNYNRLDFVYTLVKQLIALGNPHYLVGALDEQALRGLQEHQIPAFFMDSGLTTKDYGWGTYNFRQLGLHKVQLVLDLAKTGVDALTIDADAFVLRDPFPYFRALAEADVLMSSDHLVASNGYEDEGLENESGFHSAFNIGYIFIKARAVEFVQKWRDQCFERKNDWDQVLFANVLRRGSSHGTGPKRLRPMFRLSNGSNVLAGVLPVSLFASGHTHFVSRMAHLMHTHPYMVHTTFQYGGAQGKKHRLREGMMWEDSPSYYTEPNFLVYDLDLPYRLVYPNGGPVLPDGTQAFSNRMSVEQHFELVHHQLTQMRNGFALAQKLGRILILPRLVCGLDRWWAPHSGIIPGSAARLPLLDCPADHVIDVERMGEPEKYLREHSMLCNPRTPQSVLDGIRRVTAPTVPVPAAGSAPPAEGTAFVSRLATEHAATKVLSLSSVPDYRTFLPKGEAARFEQTVRGYAGLWCCKNPPGGRGAGHIWYDYLADVIPHKDRHNRNWDKAWTPIMGP